MGRPYKTSVAAATEAVTKAIDEAFLRTRMRTQREAIAIVKAFEDEQMIETGILQRLEEWAGVAK